ncbi:MAG: hypothetical protein OXE99_07275 [Cellvibrionales bacterium]|nr:hypothetical protein [Cellvibrionales bacterium]
MRVLFALLITLSYSLLYAGADGHIIMAYFFDSPLNKDLKVTIDTANVDSKCVYDHNIKGNKEFTIPAQTLGFYALNSDNPIYFHSKSSSTGGDLCNTDPTYFGVEVTADDSRYSFISNFSTKSGNFFERTSHISFRGDAPSNQAICPGKAYCSKDTYHYHYTHTPTVYVIYRPTY